MNETLPTSAPATTTSTGTPDDVWGVNRPPALPPTAPGEDGNRPAGPTGPRSSRSAGSPHLDRGFATLRRSPLRRDTTRGVLGGVSAGIARRLDVSPNAVRLAAVVLALFFGVGAGAYLIAWAALPDDQGRTHAEQAVRDGRPASLAVVALAALPVLGVLVGVLGTAWPVLLAMAVVAYMVAKKTGHASTHAHR